MKIKTKYCAVIFLLVISSASIFSQQPANEQTTLTGRSRVDWTQQKFISDISLDTQKAGFKLPSNRNAAARRLSTKLPVLVKDPFLSLLIDSDKTIDDLIRDGTVTLEQVTDIIENGRRSRCI